MNKEQFRRANRMAFIINLVIITSAVLLMVFQGLETGFGFVVISELIAAAVGYVMLFLGITKDVTKNLE